jgi:HD superfamily phosphohydrolase
MQNDFEVVRDPLWDNIRLDAAALAVLDTPQVQRLRYVRQLGHAFLVYPGATHTRFEHALGAYHLTRLALQALDERGELGPLTGEQRQAVKLAALLHDIGHYPFSHALEEAGFPSHEQLGVKRLSEPELAAPLEQIGGKDFATEVGALIVGRSTSPVAGLISGSLDLDKVDYLSRDAYMCGVPYGTVDVDRLLASLTLVPVPASDQRPATRDGAHASRLSPPASFQVGVHEKGISALESLLFAKYQMYRNVYWHHAVRSATCMFKRAVRDAVASDWLDPREVATATDDAVMELLVRAGSTLARAVRERRLYKRALELPASDVPVDAQDWVTDDPALLAQVEDRLATEIGLEPGHLLLDYPSRTRMLSVDLPLRTRDGRVDRLTDAGRAGQLGLPAVAEHLYQSARRLRAFVSRPVTVNTARLLDLITQPAADVAHLLSVAKPLLHG